MSDPTLLRDALNLLTALQWGDEAGDINAGCPTCGYITREAHALDCDLWLVLERGRRHTDAILAGTVPVRWPQAGQWVIVTGADYLRVLPGALLHRWVPEQTNATAFATQAAALNAVHIHGLGPTAAVVQVHTVSEGATPDAT